MWYDPLNLHHRITWPFRLVLNRNSCKKGDPSLAGFLTSVGAAICLIKKI